MNPEISIIIPCYKQAQYLEEALQSVLEQTFMDWECIIVDDGSPDNTGEIAQLWLNKDSRFKYFNKENGGLCSARNFGIAQALGKFILPLDADDYIAKEYVAEAMECFQNDASLKIVYCKAQKFGSSNELWELPIFSSHNLSRKNMIFCSAFFRKEDWESVGGYDLNMIYGWEDWEFWIAILKNGGNVKCIDAVRFFYRTKPSSMLTQVEEQQGEHLLEYVGVKHADFFVKHYGSFQKMEHEAERAVEEYKYKLKSEKFAIDVFCSAFFGFSIFGKYKRQKDK